jgi:hypothetical protein
MRTLAYLLPCLVLTACITPKMVDSHLETAKGQPLDSLIKKWGYPDGEQMVAGKRVVTWKDTMDGGCQRAVELDSGNRAIHVSARGDLERCYRLTE